MQSVVSRNNSADCWLLTDFSQQKKISRLVSSQQIYTQSLPIPRRVQGSRPKASPYSRTNDKCCTRCWWPCTHLICGWSHRLQSAARCTSRAEGHPDRYKPWCFTADSTHATCMNSLHGGSPRLCGCTLPWRINHMSSSFIWSRPVESRWAPRPMTHGSWQPSQYGTGVKSADCWPLIWPADCWLLTDFSQHVWTCWLLTTDCTKTTITFAFTVRFRPNSGNIKVIYGALYPLSFIEIAL